MDHLVCIGDLGICVSDVDWFRADSFDVLDKMGDEILG